jgi:glycosyltransferase involved in cell wall biosynthesis
MIVIDSKTMRLVLITDAWEPQVNGVVRTYQNIIRELEKNGHVIKVISPNDFKTIPLPFYKEISLALFPRRKMESIIKDFNPDSIHIAVEGPLGWSARKFCLNNGHSFTTSFHTHFPDYIATRVPQIFAKVSKKITILLLKTFHKHAKSIYVATDSLQDELQSWGFENHMTRLTRGVDTGIFYPNQEESKKDKPTLLYVGRVAVEKNIEAFLDMPIDAHKIVVGKGPALDKLKGRYPDVEFAGLQTGDDLANYYRQADCFVFPSKTDTFGIVLIEAMACGVPVAGYNVTGPKDLITSPVLGAFDDNLEKAVYRALSAPGTRQDRHHHVVENYSWANVALTFLRPHMT